MLSPTTGTPKQLSDSAPLSHLWLGDLVELKHLATGDLVELKHLTKDMYLGKFSDNYVYTISMTWTVKKCDTR